MNKETTVILAVVVIWWYMRATNGEGGFQWFFGYNGSDQDQVPYTAEDEHMAYLRSRGRPPE